MPILSCFTFGYYRSIFFSNCRPEELEPPNILASLCGLKGSSHLLYVHELDFYLALRSALPQLSLPWLIDTVL